MQFIYDMFCKSSVCSSVDMIMYKDGMGFKKMGIQEQQLEEQ